MNRPAPKPSLLHLSVEQENLASIPFAVLERRVGKHVSKIDIAGTKLLPDGTEINVRWQVQGNSELGLPTEQDLDIFIALGVLTFRNDFAKTITFTGREIAGILGIQGVHGKFYQRLKMAMDRFIPLRFRGVAATDRQEDIKWLNVFQEASFTLDRDSGRCVGSVTWTDKLIQSMNNGFFRVLDAGRYMELDGITAKHLYRFLAVAFEKQDLIIIDARKLAADHVGILNPPKYLSRLMQTLEPAFEQLTRIEVLGAWELALHRHKSYVPERDALLQSDPADSLALARVCCQKALEKAGFSDRVAEEAVAAAAGRIDVYVLERAARLIEGMVEYGVLPQVATGLLRKAVEPAIPAEERRDLLDACELAIQICRDKKAGGQSLRNPAGLIVKLVRDADARRRLVPEHVETASKTSYRQREHSIEATHAHAERHALIVEYERFREEFARLAFKEMPDHVRHTLRKEKAEMLREQGRLQRIDARTREEEVDNLICHDLARREAPPFEKWHMRRQARQAVLPLGSGTLAVAALQ
jgi:hypothetical protein